MKILFYILFYINKHDIKQLSYSPTIYHDISLYHI